MRVLPAFAVLVSMLVACAPQGEVRLHELVLYGSDNTRISWFYGTRGNVFLGDEEVELGRAMNSDDPLAVDEALSVGGRPYLSEPVERLAAAPVRVLTIERSSDLRVQAAADTGPVLYYDGNVWFELVGDGRPGLDTRVVPRPVVGSLPALGELTRAEVRALRARIEADGPAAVTVIDSIPAEARASDGLGEYLRTGIYVQREFGTVAATRRQVGDELVWEVMAQGNQASGFDQPAYFLVNDADGLLNLWNRAHGRQLQVPALPEVDFTRETIVALFMGERATGGYRFEPVRVSLSNGELFVDVNVIEPGPDAITTQALTSPWTMVRILRGGFQAAWIRDAVDNRILGAALPLQ